MFVKLPKCLQTDRERGREMGRGRQAMERRGDMGMSVASLAEHQRDLQFTYINNDMQQQRQAAATCSRQLYQATGLCRLRGTGRMRHHLKSGGEWQQTAGGNADAKAVGQLAMQIDFIYGCTKCLSVCGGEVV